MDEKLQRGGLAVISGDIAMNETEQTTEVFAKADASPATRPLADAAPAGTLTAAPLLMDIKLQIHVRMGRAQRSLRSIVQLGSGSVVELDCSVNDPVEIVVNGRVIAEGEIVVVGGNYGVRISRIAGSGAETALGTEHQLRQFSENLK